MLLDPNAVQASQLQYITDTLNRFGAGPGQSQAGSGIFAQQQIYPNLLDPTIARGWGVADLLASGYGNALSNPSQYLQTQGEADAARTLGQLISNTPGMLRQPLQGIGNFGVSPLIGQAAQGAMGTPGTAGGLIGEATGVNRIDPLTQQAGGLAQLFPTQNQLDPTMQGALSGFLTGDRQQQDLMRLEDSLRARSERSGERERQRLMEGQLARPGLFGGRPVGFGRSGATGTERDPGLMAIAGEQDRLRNEALENQLAGLEVDLSRQGRGESLQALGMSPNISELQNQRLAQQIGLLSGVGGQQFGQPLQALQFALGASGIPRNEQMALSALLGQLGQSQTGLGLNVLQQQLQAPLSAIGQQQSALGQLANQEGVFTPRLLQLLGLTNQAVQGPFRGVLQTPQWAPSQAMLQGLGGIGGQVNPFGGLPQGPGGIGPSRQPSQQATNPGNLPGPTPQGRDARLGRLNPGGGTGGLGGGGGPYLGPRGYWESGTGDITRPGDAGSSGGGDYSLDPRLSDPFQQGLGNDPYSPQGFYRPLPWSPGPGMGPGTQGFDEANQSYAPAQRDFGMRSGVTGWTNPGGDYPKSVQGPGWNRPPWEPPQPGAPPAPAPVSPPSPYIVPDGSGMWPPHWSPGPQQQAAPPPFINVAQGGIGQIGPPKAVMGGPPIRGAGGQSDASGATVIDASGIGPHRELGDYPMSAMGPGGLPIATTPFGGQGSQVLDWQGAGNPTQPFVSRLMPQQQQPRQVYTGGGYAPVGGGDVGPSGGGGWANGRFVPSGQQQQRGQGQGFGLPIATTPGPGGQSQIIDYQGMSGGNLAAMQRGPTPNHPLIQGAIGQGRVVNPQEQAQIDRDMAMRSGGNQGYRQFQMDMYGGGGQGAPPPSQQQRGFVNMFGPMPQRMGSVQPPQPTSQQRGFANMFGPGGGGIPQPGQGLPSLMQPPQPRKFQPWGAM